MSKFNNISQEQNASESAAHVLNVQEPLLNVIDKESLQRLPIQRKLSIGSIDDPLEHEADAVADKVMRMPGPNLVQRKCASCEEEEIVQSKPLASFIQKMGNYTGMTASDSVSQKINSTKGGGNNLDSSTKSFMENRFGTDFSGVKIHTGDYAVQMSQELNAQAFTVGNDVYFNSGKYNPNSNSGKHLLAHELTHTVQQGGTIHRKCDKTVKPEAVISDHSVDKVVIEKPGEKVIFTVKFSCEPKYGGYSKLSDTSSSFSKKSINVTGSTEYKRTWDGKKPFSSIGTFIEDGEYNHEIEDLKYANDGKTDLFASGAKLKSPDVTVRVRSGIDPGKVHNHYNTANVTALSRIIISEMEEGNDTAKKTIAWCVRNQMYRLNTFDVITAKNFFKDAFGKAGNSDTDTIAKNILQQPISKDTTSGALKWFSPKRMAPSKVDAETKGHDCGGGVQDVVDDTGKTVKRCFPSFSGSMTKVAVTGVSEWILKIYKL